MRIYVDDDSVRKVLCKRLLRAGHDVTIPAQVNLDGHRDSEHMTFAIQNDCVLLTRNHDDFECLDNLIRSCGGHHPGIAVVRLDNDQRDMKPHEVVAALGKLTRAIPNLTDQYQILNHWR